MRPDLKACRGDAAQRRQFLRCPLIVNADLADVEILGKRLGDPTDPRVLIRIVRDEDQG